MLAVTSIPLLPACSRPHPCSNTSIPSHVPLQHAISSHDSAQTQLICVQEDLPEPHPASKVTPRPCRQLGEQEVAMMQRRAARRSPGEAAGLMHMLITAGREHPCREDLAHHCPPSAAASSARAPGQLSLQMGRSHQVKPRQEECCNF